MRESDIRMVVRYNKGNDMIMGNLVGKMTLVLRSVACCYFKVAPQWKNNRKLNHCITRDSKEYKKKK